MIGRPPRGPLVGRPGAQRSPLARPPQITPGGPPAMHVNRPEMRAMNTARGKPTTRQNMVDPPAEHMKRPEARALRTARGISAPETFGIPRTTPK